KPDGEVAAGADAGATSARPALSRGIRRREKGPAGLVEKIKAMEPKKRLMLFGGVGVVLLLLVIFAATRPKAPAAIDPKKSEAAEKMQMARDAVRSERYEEAISLIDQAEKLVP